MRFYDEYKYGAEHILPVEMYYFFQNALKENLKVFFLRCDPKHSIHIPDKDLNFLKKSIKMWEEVIYLNHIFSENVLKIKELQHQDILKFYKIAIEKNQISALFFHPNLKNDFYCFDIFLIIQPNLILNELLDLDLNLVKIDSVIEYNSNTLTLELMKKTYNLLNVQFKDHIVSSHDLKKTRHYNYFDLK